MRILLDVMGGDNAPNLIVEGAVMARREVPEDVEIMLVGKEDLLREALKEAGGSEEEIRIIPASEVITNDEAPVRAVRRKKDSSIAVGMRMLRDGEADAFLSAGSTGAILAGSLLIVGRIRGIDRPTLATVYPVIGHQPSLLVDTGANAECRPGNLRDFGLMGSIYMEHVLNRDNPSVGLVNNGTEPGKGTELTKEAYKLLDESGLNFIGNVETRELQNAVCDVIVTDGFTGNAIIKLTEGLGLMMLRELKQMFTASGKTKLGALLMKDQLRGMKRQFDYKEYGGAPILGVKKAVLKMHGSSDATAVCQTIRKAVPYVEHDVCGIIEHEVEALTDKA